MDDRKRFKMKEAWHNKAITKSQHEQKEQVLQSSRKLQSGRPKHVDFMLE